MARLSGLQREVLALYRKCLRASRKKPAMKEARKHFEAYARLEFNKSITLDKKDFNTIEYLLRKGQRQVDMYSSPGIKDIR
ncbi:similar to complex 1 protein (LYR family) protein [Botrytis cinerea T4]|uniref:Similar to complex 1 protein (LYR family) protein n=1 Tax=Botryotinia fuckeliana (strain T4) TaxID=999810 RepID=G2XYP0_BOTF4|nr:similar to complex 1 protein (LYR family) protein [Botrytis cinerea T4]